VGSSTLSRMAAMAYELALAMSTERRVAVTTVGQERIAGRVDQRLIDRNGPAKPVPVQRRPEPAALAALLLMAGEPFLTMDGAHRNACASLPTGAHEPAASGRLPSEQPPAAEGRRCDIAGRAQDATRRAVAADGCPRDAGADGSCRTFPRHRQGDPDTTGKARTPAKIRRPGDGQDRTPPDATSRHFPNPARAFGGNSGDDASPHRGTAAAAGEQLVDDLERWAGAIA
jgi:hypothetical protein